MINPNILVIPPFVAHQYLVKGQNGYLLIDTGLSNSYTKVTRFFRKNNIPLAAIELIVITHADGDHFGNLARIQATKAGIISAASQLEGEAIRKGKSSRELRSESFSDVLMRLARPLFRMMPAQIDRSLEIGEELPYLGGLEVIDSCGHTPGHISLWSKSTRTLFCGDSIKINGKTLSPSIGGNTWNLEKARVSFEKQLALGPDRIYAGHGIWQRE